ncbi:acyl-ACP thioesterase [Pediococcus acidilactici]|uniref:acyl-[acyl-carrier-protein] thioesterase n=1 Tax=Pediococcus acidilactici TaxID=1254 RepID=UPI000878891E|nr:acyl-ACP thioesterase domain-containing protein [Pediococcus acidilactici]AOW74365.1 acyl-ACP thioesterase [Pediococcus acidilactici]
MAGKIHEEEHLVTYYEGDQTGTMTVSMMVNVMLLVSDNQSQALGVGPEVVDQTGLGWVITQYVMQLRRLPNVGERIVVGTQAVNHNDYFCQRDFWIKTLDGKKIVETTAMFVLMDRTTRRMRKLLPEIIDPYESDYIKRIVRLPKLQEITGETNQQDYAVRYFDIDMNHHVNNARYFEWIFNTVNDDILDNYFPKMVNIRYHVEIQPHQMVHSVVEFDRDGLRSSHQISVGDTLCCEANVEWARR